MNIGPTISDKTVISSTILETEFFQGVCIKWRIPEMNAPE
jgi:hypothetical protein